MLALTCQVPLISANPSNTQWPTKLWRITRYPSGETIVAKSLVVAPLREGSLRSILGKTVRQQGCHSNPVVTRAGHHSACASTKWSLAESAPGLQTSGDLSDQVLLSKERTTNRTNKTFPRSRSARRVSAITRRYPCWARGPMGRSTSACIIRHSL